MSLEKGMTKCLIISNKNDVTSDIITYKLHEKGIPYYRFNTEDLSHTINICLDFKSNLFYLEDLAQKSIIDLSLFTSIYYRRPQLHRYKSEDLDKEDASFLQREDANILIGIYHLLQDARWVNSPFAIRYAENKPYQLMIAQEIGFSIPDSMITNIPLCFHKMIERNGGDCVTKAISSSNIGRELPKKIVFTNRLTGTYTNEKIRFAPTYLQANIVKSCDIRITVVGEKIFAVAIMSKNNSSTKIDWRAGYEKLEYQIISLPDHITELCLRLVKFLHLTFAAIDMVKDVLGIYYFLEINPNGQWGWIEEETDLDISGAIIKELINDEK